MQACEGCLELDICVERLHTFPSTKSVGRCSRNSTPAHGRDAVDKGLGIRDGK